MDNQQPELFRPSPDIRDPLKAALAKALKASPLSRAQVVDKLNSLLEAHGLPQRITQNVMDRWCATSAKNQIPIILLPFFCQTLGTLEPLQVLAAPLGAAVAGEREQALLLLGKAQLEAKQAQRRRRLALEALKEGGL
jgi:hypothetical protein